MPVPEFSDPPRMLIVVAPFFREITDMLVNGATRALARSRAVHDIVEVPGSIEIPTAIKIASTLQKFEGFVALGCVMRGETTHYETVCTESSRGLTLLGLTGLCIGNGILTVENAAQAKIRADPDQEDKGGGAADAAMHLVKLARKFEFRLGDIGFHFQDGVPRAARDS